MNQGAKIKRDNTIVLLSITSCRPLGVSGRPWTPRVRLPSLSVFLSVMVFLRVFGALALAFSVPLDVRDRFWYLARVLQGLGACGRIHCLPLLSCLSRPSVAVVCCRVCCLQFRLSSLAVGCR